MRNKTKKILAWVALGCMAVFVVCLVAWGFNRTLLNGAIGFAAIFFGGLGIALYLVLRFGGPKIPPGENGKSEDGAAKPPADSDKSAGSDGIADSDKNSNSDGDAQR